MLVMKLDTVNELRNEFTRCDRDQFTYKGYEVILNYFNEFEEDMELDVIAICCDFNEITFEEFVNDYSLELEEDETDEEAVINYLDNNAGFYQILDDTVIYTVF